MDKARYALQLNLCTTTAGAEFESLLKQNANKVSGAFAGTREKCVGCKKTVYPIERVSF